MSFKLGTIVDLNKKVLLLIKRVMIVIDWQAAVSAILKLLQGISPRVGGCSPTSNRVPMPPTCLWEALRQEPC